MFTGAKNEIKLICLDPGHFHAALIQKSMYDRIDPVVHVYAPEGPDAEDHLNHIKEFNARTENPTYWEEKLVAGPDFLEKMLDEKKGNVVIISGNNKKKTEFILRTVNAGMNVLADKPMVIYPEEFPGLEESFRVAEEKGVLLYDIMTERHEITTMLQRELSQMPEVFGELQSGTPEEPAITKESVHHFFKYVAGNPIKRPAWFFDAEQQGESIADVGTHLIDLIQWEAFPGIILKKEDVEIVSARRWPTPLTREMFKKVVHMEDFPGYLDKYTDGDVLQAMSNGEMVYKLKDIYAKVSVIWNFEAPGGTGDTHYSIMRGTNCNLKIVQGEDEGYVPALYIEAAPDQDPEAFSVKLKASVKKLTQNYPGIELRKPEDKRWVLDIPETYRVGHEAHFAQVTEQYLNYLSSGHMPEWEVPNMIVKYYTSMQGVKKTME